MDSNMPSIQKQSSRRRKKADPNGPRAKAARERNKNPCRECKRSRQKCFGGTPCSRCWSKSTLCEPGEGINSEATMPVFVFETGQGGTKGRPRSNTVATDVSINSPINEASGGQDYIVSPVSPISQPPVMPDIAHVTSPTTELSVEFAGLNVDQPRPLMETLSLVTSDIMGDSVHHEQALYSETGTKHSHLDGHATLFAGDGPRPHEDSLAIASETLFLSIPGDNDNSNMSLLDPSLACGPAGSAISAEFSVQVPQDAFNQTSVAGNSDPTALGFDSSHIDQFRPYVPEVPFEGFSPITDPDMLQRLVDQSVNPNPNLSVSGSQTNFNSDLSCWLQELASPIEYLLAVNPLQQHYPYPV